MTYDRVVVGNEIRRRRTLLGLTQEQAAEKIDRALRFYARIERGEVGMSVDTLLAVCDLLKTTPDSLLLGETTEAASANIAWISSAIGNCPIDKQEIAIELLQVFLKSV